MSMNNRLLGFFVLLLIGPAAHGQFRALDFERPEAWAMAYMTASTLYHGFDVPNTVQPRALRFGAEIANIPKIDEADLRVGFNGNKLEDLNKSPVFGRGRLWVGLPWDLSMELAYTPPVQIDGVRADRIVGLALGRPLFRHDNWRIGARAFAQHGRASGDITCSREVVAFGVDDFENNPFGCRAPSDDEAELDHYGVEFSAIWQRDGLSPMVAWSIARIDPHVQVNAQVFDTVDRAQLATEGYLRSGTLGVEYRMKNDMRWFLAGTWTPLEVDRRNGRESDDFWSIHLLFQIQPSHLGL
jgi:hypothetical protein